MELANTAEVRIRRSDDRDAPFDRTRGGEGVVDEQAVSFPQLRGAQNKSEVQWGHVDEHQRNLLHLLLIVAEG